jgi:uncharacterized protein (DUF2141 family)
MIKPMRGGIMARNWSRFESVICLPLVLAAGACGGGDAEDAAVGGESASSAAPAAAQIENPATITGTVSFTGTAPAPEPIDMSEEPTCAEKHQEPPVMTRVAANDGRLANVFVYVREGLTGEYPAAGAAPVLDQEGCEYHPHVLGVQTGQEFTIRNSDGLLHNINANPTENRGFNSSQPVNMDTEQSFSTPEVMIPVRCDVHGWMEAYIGVVDHPYFAVTGEDGSFQIENLPPGSYVIEAWHETLGTQTMNVTVGPNESGTADFSYDAASALNAEVPLGEPLVIHWHGEGNEGI